MSPNGNSNEPSEAAYGRFALANQVGPRFSADWKSGNHRARRLVSEFIGTFGLTFVLSGGAAILAAHGGAELAAFQYAFTLSAVSALWLVAAVYCLGDISAHFNPAMTLAFTLRGDMGWPMAGAYILVQFIAAAAGSVVAAWLFGFGGNLAAVMPQPGQYWQAVVFEGIQPAGELMRGHGAVSVDEISSDGLSAVFTQLADPLAVAELAATIDSADIPTWQNFAAQVAAAAAARP